MITRFFPCAPAGDGPFSLLLLGQGFEDAEFYSIVAKVWNEITILPSFNQFKLDGRYRIAVYFDSCLTNDFKLQQQNNVISVDPSDSHLLSDYLKNAIMPDIDKTPLSIWGENYYGPVGSLIAIIKKGNSAGELYQIDYSDTYPIPFVAVIATGDYWTKVIIRAIGEREGCLANEYDLPGPDYEKDPNDGLYWDQYFPPNLIFINDAQRTDLDNGKNPLEVIPRLPFSWPVNAGASLKFYRYGSADPNIPGIKLVEGGDGYRKNVLHSDFDCLMRRIPNSTQYQIQADVDFCKVCSYVIFKAIRGNSPETQKRIGRRLIGNQRLLYDELNWKNTAEITVDASQSYSIDSQKSGSVPKWQCSFDITPDSGLRITSLKLKDRTNINQNIVDPFDFVEEIVKEISFKDLYVKFKGESDPTSLNISDALSNSDNPPILEQSTVGGPASNYQIGLKLTLSWSIPKKCKVEVAMSLVLRDQKNDFDPGGAAIACKFYPQMSMRYKRIASSKDALPSVEWLKGTIVIKPDNVIPSSHSTDPMLGDMKQMANDAVQVVLLTDSNSSKWDNVWYWNRFTGASTFAKAAPTWGMYGADWQAGRKLARVRNDPSLVAPDPKNVIGATALRGFQFEMSPVLPHWSWLFDYGVPAVLGNRPSFVGVYCRGEQTVDTKNDGGLPRQTVFVWPSPTDQNNPSKNYKMIVRKVSRQGTFDNVHVSAFHGLDSRGFYKTPAPFCAELCLHLHWRWGMSAVSPVGNIKSYFMGWGNGKLDQGAATTIGAPLIPPNQHLDVKVSRSIAGNEAEINYIVTAYNPSFNEQQVFLEQGVGFAFSYAGLSDEQVALLVIGTEVIIPDASVNPWKDPAKDIVSNLQSLDARAKDMKIRMYFDKIYDQIRWYDNTIDDIPKGNNVQQIPSILDPSDSKNLLAPQELENM
ncbi:hypothetical protein DYY66_1987 [Candidatus Nitrosotalea sp. FS]|uniref:hypothetical protein n=1 Tax=Candidatus Nitrosotalea sp. FS TaxID=2341021 RepID=UPI00140E2117|nr:hypothetical protein [Candidatus Nitrosotalea sp. FS]NHH98694.1 hypothetical protein [Candidatus Nitrosotalea sp. FS]